MSEIFLKILNMSISASWLVLAVLLLRLVLKRAPKWVSVLLWGFVAVRLIFPFSIESVLSLIPSAQTVSPEIMLDWTPTISTGIGSLDNVVNPIITQTFAPNPVTSANPLQNLIPVLGNLWVLGILVMLVYTGVSYLVLRRKVATAVLLQKNIFQSENVDSPFVLGIFKPRIYLPFRMDGQNLAFVIAHEEAHIRRKDHWWKPIGFLLLALHWFNPLMWLGYILLCRDIELACDEKVIKEMDNEHRADYTQALVACSVNRRAIAACPLAFGEVGVKERVKSVMNYKKPAFWIIVAAIVTCIAVAVCFLTNPKTSANNDPSLPLDIQDPNASQFAATILEVHDTYLLVAPEGGTRESSSADKIEVSLQNLESLPTFQAGYSIMIVYDGLLQETYPARVNTVYRVEIMNFGSSPIETVYGNVRTYFRNADNTWQTGGREYKRRLVLTGRMPNAAQDTTFVYLSNLDRITFEQAYKAAGFGNGTEDYFAVEDVILVEWMDVTPGGNAEDSSKLDAAITNAILLQYRDSVPDGYLATASYILVSQGPVYFRESYYGYGSIGGIGVHVYYLYQLFDVTGNYPVEYTGIFQEADIHFELDEEGNCIQRGFYRPQYAAEYMGALPQYSASGNEDIAENQQQYEEQLQNSCWASATAYIENRNAGQSITESVYGDVIDRIIYDIDTDGKDEICTLIYVKTNGVFSFCFDISSAEENSTYIKYRQSYILRRYDSLSFDLAENGQLRIRAERNIDSNDVVYFDITLKDGDILLHCDEEGIFLT